MSSFPWIPRTKASKLFLIGNIKLDDYQSVNIIPMEVLKFISKKADVELANGKVGGGVND